MKKVNIYRFCNYALISLISCNLVLSQISPALTQTVSLINPMSAPATNLIWPTQGVLSQGFRKYQHEGIDIAAAKGTPILAAAAGKVVKASWDDWGLGNFIEIKHLNGNVTVYGHNSRLLVSKGQQVKQGQIIAEMGSTGNSTAPHLHFEFYADGRLASNPLSLLPSATIAKTSVNQPVTPTPQPVSHASNNTDCRGTTVMNGETATVSIKVCEENGQLFYLGKLKQEPSQVLKIRAWKVDNNKYQAENGTFSYLISPEKIEIWRNGSQIRADSFLTSHGLGK
ncbi:M23 family metallopeptidase [Dolichospermum compactum]|uniref:Peptidase M23B n=1 Tax=Dolichospermum compactum NIES-806 TaxID=1973481 RepID=A0A1Z4V0A9_9CYAN|nr:M23 family metallopeptidase [Dolichospermum compactum]BAZ84863.1 peptidase M23B [Dolichospermum compactum NIES-806]